MVFTKVEEATYWLLNQINPLPRPNMKKMYQALEQVGNPHLGLKVLHITGTNGKGSTVAYLRQLLASQDLKVGSFTSPHIERFNERITFDGQQISDQDLLRLTNRLVDLNDYMEENSPWGKLIYFELFTIMMCLYFQEKEPDVCLIEAGIGGMSDCTNILDGEVAVISSIALDHADLLGDTFEAVALEKAGIIKSGKRVVTGKIEASPLAVIDKWAQARQAQHDQYGQAYQISQVDRKGAQGSQYVFSSQDLGESQLDVKINMLGDHQIRNSALAIQAFIAWMDHIGQDIDWSKALTALGQTSWIGRLERLSEAPYIYVDGAHNMEGLTALKKVVQDNLAGYQITIIYGGLKKKNQAEQVPLLLTYQAQEVCLTSFNHFESMQEEDFSTILEDLEEKPKNRVRFVADWREWIDQYQANHQGEEDSLLLITGSLYFVSEARSYLMDKIK